MHFSFSTLVPQPTAAGKRKEGEEMGQVGIVKIITKEKENLVDP